MNTTGTAEPTGTHDVIVVGAGPAGSVAARQLASVGRDVLVIDRSDFPRDKACGDLLSTRAIRTIEGLGLENVLDGWRRTSNGPLAIPRRVFDSRLLASAAGAGAKFLRASFLDVAGGDDALTVVASLPTGERVELGTRLVVGADGASSRVVRSAWGHRGGAGNRRAFAHRQYMRWNRGPIPDRPFDFRPTAWGEPEAASYAWEFRIDEELANVGVCLWEPAVTDAAGHLVEFVQDLSDQRGSPISTTAPRGGWINFDFGAVPPVLEGRIALVGDALGLADPTSGEGISHALRSGLMAARSIDRALDGSDLYDYALEVGREFAHPIARGLRQLRNGMTVAGPRDGLVPSEPRQVPASPWSGDPRSPLMSPDVVDVKCVNARLLASPTHSELTELSRPHAEVLDEILRVPTGQRPHPLGVDRFAEQPSAHPTGGEAERLISHLLERGVFMAGDDVDDEGLPSAGHDPGFVGRRYGDELAGTVGGAVRKPLHQVEREVADGQQGAVVATEPSRPDLRSGRASSTVNPVETTVGGAPVRLVRGAGWDSRFLPTRVLMARPGGVQRTLEGLGLAVWVVLDEPGTLSEIVDRISSSLPEVKIDPTAVEDAVEALVGADVIEVG